MPPSRADEVQTWNLPGPQLQQSENAQQPRPPTAQGPPHKFKLGPDQVMVTESKTVPGTEGAQPDATVTELDPLDKELGRDKVKDVLRNYFEETESALRGLI